MPLFQRQLREGVPLTITDPEMTRYFMTIPEASRLILQASLFGEPGDLFVLDMGEPVRIVDLARDLARLAGRDPDSVPIRYIGLRPGEKLHESLFYEAESIEPTAHPKVLRARAASAADREPEDVLTALEELVAVGASGDHAASRVALRATLDRLDPAAGPDPRVTDEPIPFHRPCLGAAERDAVVEVLDSGWLTTGRRAAAFEQAFAAYVGRGTRRRRQQRDGRAPPRVRGHRRRSRRRGDRPDLYVRGVGGDGAVPQGHADPRGRRSDHDERRTPAVASRDH